MPVATISGSGSRSMLPTVIASDGPPPLAPAPNQASTGKPGLDLDVGGGDRGDDEA
jgi:hypothetical protein